MVFVRTWPFSLRKSWSACCRYCFLRRRSACAAFLFLFSRSSRRASISLNVNLPPYGILAGAGGAPMLLQTTGCRGRAGSSSVSSRSGEDGMDICGDGGQSCICSSGVELPSLPPLWVRYSHVRASRCQRQALRSWRGCNCRGSSREAGGHGGCSSQPTHVHQLGRREVPIAVAAAARPGSQQRVAKVRQHLELDALRRVEVRQCVAELHDVGAAVGERVVQVHIHG